MPTFSEEFNKAHWPFCAAAFELNASKGSCGTLFTPSFQSSRDGRSKSLRVVAKVRYVRSWGNIEWRTHPSGFKPSGTYNPGGT